MQNAVSRCRPVTVGIHRLCHMCIGSRLGKESHSFLIDALLIRADEAHGSRCDRLGTFRGVTQDEHRLAEGGGLLLNAA